MGPSTAHAAGRESLILEWANDPATRRNAVSTDRITPAAHHDWFREKLEHPESCKFFIAETPQRLPVGQVRFDEATSGWQITFALAPAFRGARLGAVLLETALRTLRREIPEAVVLGLVRTANTPSREVFSTLAFEETEAAPGFVEYRLPGKPTASRPE